MRPAPPGLAPASGPAPPRAGQWTRAQRRPADPPPTRALRRPAPASGPAPNADRPTRRRPADPPPTLALRRPGPCAGLRTRAQRRPADQRRPGPCAVPRRPADPRPTPTSADIGSHARWQCRRRKLLAKAARGRSPERSRSHRRSAASLSGRQLFHRRSGHFPATVASGMVPARTASPLFKSPILP